MIYLPVDKAHASLLHDRAMSSSEPDLSKLRLVGQLLDDKYRIDAVGTFSKALIKTSLQRIELLFCHFLNSLLLTTKWIQRLKHVRGLMWKRSW